MEKLKLHLIQLNKALITLKKAFEVAEKLALTNDIDFIAASEDSIIQRFEYTYENFWKFLKKYLETTYKTEDINSPRKIFAACVRVKICTLEEGNLFLDMAEDRNETSHTYNIESARKILPDIPEYYMIILSVVERFNTEMKSDILFQPKQLSK